MRISNNSDFGESVGLDTKYNYWFVGYPHPNIKLIILPSSPFTITGEDEYNGIILRYASHRVNGWKPNTFNGKTNTQNNKHLDIIDEVLSKNDFLKLPANEVQGICNNLKLFWFTAGFDNLYHRVPFLMLDIIRKKITEYENN